MGGGPKVESYFPQSGSGTWHTTNIYLSHRCFAEAGVLRGQKRAEGVKADLLQCGNEYMRTLSVRVQPRETGHKRQTVKCGKE